MQSRFPSASGRVAHGLRSLWLALFVAFSMTAFVGCAQDVGDIDRTQPNKTLKTDLDGVWYMLETVTQVPSTSRASFEGETSKMEKIVWKVEENLLFAYRAYPLIPGTGNVEVTEPDGYVVGADGVDIPVYGEPVAAFTIISHFDVVREYNASTGEESNVIIENSWDRPWYERSYMRVDWSRNRVTNFDFISGWFWSPVEASYTIDTEREDSRSIYWERDDADQLAYFDVPRRLLLEPDLWGCIVSLPWYGWDTQDCAPAEVEIVTSFARTAPTRDYEPLYYDDQNMTRFGYFRTERYAHDPQRGILESTRQELINRHNIWASSYELDGEGNFVRDANGRRIPIPVADREPRTVPYYLNQEFPEDPLIRQVAADVMRDWNEVGQEAAAQAKGTDAGSVGNIFVLCNNPVAAGDDPACGAEGMLVRPGDLRYSTFHWVESSQLEGPLGYGPSAVDPESGEIISGRAYCYGEGMNTYAAYGLDVVRFINGDLPPEELANLEHARAAVLDRAFNASSPDVSEHLHDVPLGDPRMRDPRREARREEHREHLNHFDRTLVDSRMERAREAGLGAMLTNDDYASAVSARLGVARDLLTQEDIAKTDPTTWMSPTHMKDFQRKRRKAMARSLDYPDMLDGNVIGFAKKFEGRTDYDTIWNELRSEIFRATMLHEVGHTVGLRHNFQGTYDSLNYHDEYWNLRVPTLYPATNYAELYDLSELSQEQIDGNMRNYQYSSIMDYGYTFNTDLEGLGKYDRAALVYGYTGGAVARPGAECNGNDRITASDGTCLVNEMGFVEVFGKSRGDLAEAGQILGSTDELGLRFDDPTTPIVPYLERWHYTTFMQSFPTVADAFDREWMRLEDVKATRDGSDTERIRVPYLFCSDEWAGALLSCQVFDAGADPWEMTKTIIDGYRDYYYFRNFKRDRLGWDPFEVLFREFYYTFLPLSDYYQNWYLAPFGTDPILDDYWWIAVNAGFNLIAEAIATPPYGTFCTQPNGRLFNLVDEPGLDPGLASDYYLTTYCDPDRPFYEVPQGVGRRRFSTYDFEAGYNFADLPLEAGHYWTTVAAVWALIDPEAFVLGTDADAGVFSISYYDYFDTDVNRLANAVLTEQYGAYSPILTDIVDEGGNRTGKLVHQPLSQVWDPDGQYLFDPETGQETSAMLGGSRASAAHCEPCEASSDCVGYSQGLFGEVFCTPLAALGAGQYCIQDCFNDPNLCGPGATCDADGWCVPDDNSCDANDIPVCGAGEPFGACPGGQRCDNGSCIELAPVVETDATFALADDLIFYGMFYTTFNYSTRYNDQLYVFRVGAEQQEAGEGFGVVTFTDPISGHAYGAIAEECDLSAMNPSAHCQFGLNVTTGGAALVIRGQELAQRYNDTLAAYYNNSDTALDTELYWHHSRASFELETHIEKLNDIRAVYDIFGKVY